MSTPTPATTAPKESLMHKVEGFFGIKKESDNVHAQADAEAHARAALVADKGIPQPVPSAVLADVKAHKGVPEHVHHVNVIEHPVDPVGHVVKDPTLLDKMSAAFKNLTTSHSTAATTTTTAPATTTTTVGDKIPHAAVPDQVLADVKAHKGTPEHVHHVAAPVEHHVDPVGHVVKDPSLLDKMGAKLHNLTSSSTTASTATAAPATTTTVHSTDAIPHSALPNQVLKDVVSHKGTPEHVHHVAAPVEHSSVPLGHVVKDPSLMDKMNAKIHDITSSSTTTAPAATTTSDKIPHSALPNQVLADVKSHKGTPEHVHHVETVSHSSVPLGHVIADPTLMDKMSAKIHDLTSSSTPSTATTTSDKIPHSSLPTQVLTDVKSHKGTPEHVQHVETVIHSSLPLGHVVDKRD